MTQRGQVTMPADVRRLLGLKPHDHIAFVIEDGHVRLERPEFTLQTAYGSVTPHRRPENWEEVIRLAKEERAEVHTG